MVEEACNNFRTYLHSSGVAEALSSALLSLYHAYPQPENPIEFIRQHLPPEQVETIATLKTQLTELRNDYEKLQNMLPKEVVFEPKVSTSQPTTHIASERVILSESANVTENKSPEEVKPQPDAIVEPGPNQT